MKPLVVDSVRALISIAGAGLLGYGAWLHYPPLGFMVGGGLLVVVGLLATLRARP